jgi:hypothetical protein
MCLFYIRGHLMRSYCRVDHSDKASSKKVNLQLRLRRSVRTNPHLKSTSTTLILVLWVGIVSFSVELSRMLQLCRPLKHFSASLKATTCFPNLVSNLCRHLLSVVAAFSPGPLVRRKYQPPFGSPLVFTARLYPSFLTL